MGGQTWIVTVAIATAVLSLQVARADSLPSALYEAGFTINSDSTDVELPGISTFGECPGPLNPVQACLTADFFNTPDFGVSASAIAFPFGYTNVDATAIFFYEVAGPDGVDARLSVTPFLHYAVSGSAVTSSWDVAALINIQGDGGAVGGNVAFCSLVGPCSPDTRTNTLPFSARTNTVYSVSIGARAQIQNTSDSTDFLVTALSDPDIVFASGFDSTGFSILVSDGVSNGAPAAPEPASAALFAAAIMGAVPLRRYLLRRKG